MWVRIRYVLVLCIFSVGLLGLPLMPVHAQIPAPDSGPFIDRVDIYRHCLEDDDQLAVVRYRWPYDDVPSETITEIALGRYMDGAVTLGVVAPYAYYNQGFGSGMFSVYLDAADAAVNAPWEGAYTLELLGSPTLDWLNIVATISMLGAVADDGGAQTDETAESNSAAAGDLTLLPAVPAVNDAYYFGGTEVFSLLTLNIGTQGDGTWTIVWEYRDADGWQSLASVIDDTEGFEATAGNHDVSFDVPDDWTSYTVNGITAFWIRARVSAYTAVVTQPLGTQCWVNSGGSIPYASAGTINWRATTSQGATRALMFSHLILYAEELSDQWSVALTTVTAEGSRLSGYGETYFSNAIPQLRVMCPQLFTSSVSTPTPVDTEWEGDTANTTISAWPLEWGGMSTWLGMPSDDLIFRTVIGFVIIFIVCTIALAQTQRTDVTVIVGFVLMVVAAGVGLISPLIVGGFVFVAIVLTGLVFILQGTS